MAIDNKLEKLKQNLQDDPTLPKELAKYATKFGLKLLPDMGIVSGVLIDAILSIFEKSDNFARIKETLQELIDVFQTVETTYIKKDDAYAAMKRVVFKEITRSVNAT
jgi:hypothetical protein